MLVSRRSLVALSVFVLAGCASTRSLDRAWIEVRSENFSIYSSMDEPEARQMLENLELFRSALLVVTKLRDTKPRVPTEIYAFQSSGDFAEFRPARNVAGFFVPGLRVNWVALDAGKSTRLARAILYHEYTHFLVRNEGRAAPPIWFDEGFAELLGAVDVLGTMVRVGAVPAHRIDWLMYAPKIPYSQVIRARSFAGWTQNELGAFYAQAWLLVHYLTLGRGGDFKPRLDRYIDEVERGVEEEQAFHTAFGVEVDELSDRLQKYAKAVPSFGLPRRDLAQGLEIHVRAVPTDEIGTRLGWLAVNIGEPALAQGYFERASAANPANSRALAGIGDLHKFAQRWEEAESAYRRSLEIAPDDWQNHLEYGEYFGDRAMLEEERRDEHLGRAREHLGRAIELAPAIPEGHAALGVTYTIGDQPPGPGIESLERAARLLPANPGIDYPLAQLYVRAGQRERAIALLRRIVSQAHGEPHPDALKLLESLEAEAEPVEEAG